MSVFAPQGGVTLCCALFVAILLRDTPADAGFNQDFSQQGKKKDDDSKERNSTWKDLIRSPFLWVVSAGYLVVFAAKTSVTEWGQMYLIESLGHSPFAGIY